MAEAIEDHYSSAARARQEARDALAPRTPAESGAAKPRRLKAISRVVLPATALGIALVSFAWPLLTNTDVSFTLSQDQVTESDGRVLMQNLRYTGVDRQDRLFEVNATEGEQEDPADKRVRLTNVSARIDLDSDRDLALAAENGLYRIEEEQLSLAGNVKLTSDAGLTLEMSGAEVDLAKKTALGEGNVRGMSPLGEFSAETMNINLQNNTGIFTGRVKLKITPKRTKTSGTAAVTPDDNGATGDR